MLRHILRMILLAGVCAGFGCGDKLDPGYVDPLALGGTGGTTGGALSFSQIQPIMQAHCTTCHSVTAADRRSAPAAINFDTYADCKANAQDALPYIDGSTMPPAGFGVSTMSATEQSTFHAWVNANYPQ